MAKTRQEKKERALRQKDILRFESVIAYLEQQTCAVSKDELSKAVGVSNGSL